MKTKLLYITLLSILLLSTGCVKEDNMQLPSGPDATLSLNVPTRSSGYGEYEVENVRIASFIPQSATTAPGVLDVNGGKRALEPNGNILQTLRTGVRDVYVFTNEPEDIGRELEAMKSLADLDRITLPYTPGTLAPPFFGYHVENREIKRGYNPVMDANALRTVSKVELIITYTWGPTTNLPEMLIIESVQVKNLPTRSYLIGRPYDLVGSYIDSEIITGYPLDNGTSIPNTYRNRPLSIYIPEFLGASADNGKHAYIEIIGHLANDPTILCTYTIPLGDGMASTPMTDYNITRNTEYKILATIESYGQMDDLSVKVTVLPWNTVNQDDDTGRFIALDKVTDAADRPIADGSNLGDTGTTLKVSCNTNIGGWYTVTRDMDNKIIHKSSPTASVSSATLQTVDITIAGLSEPNYWNNYTVSIYHPTVATELVGPIVSLKFIQHWDGFIPNSILIEKGWPLFYLPPHGLQLAKRGKQVQPWGQAEAIDPAMFWGHEFVNTEFTLGAGLRNMCNMVGFDNVVGAKYPAAEYCRGMGDKWFFASRYELELIFSIVFENQDYILDSKYYWSSSLGTPTERYPYFFNTRLNKIESGWRMNQFVLQVRCVGEV